MKDNFLQDLYEPYNEVYKHDSGFKIFLGDVTAAVDLEGIKRQNIGTVITAAIDMDHVKYDSSIKHIIYNVFDSKTENLSKLFNRFYELTESELRSTNILVHCFAGISRSATLVLSYMMKKKNWGFKEAIAQVRKYRPKVLPNLGFERQLKEYQKKIIGFGLEYDRQYVSKTSESKKHAKKMTLGLPEIVGLGSTIPRIKHIQAPPQIEPMSQQQSRKLRLPKKIMVTKVEDQFTDLRMSQSKKLQMKSFRKRSISINRQGQQKQQPLDGQLFSRQGKRIMDSRTVFGQKLNLNQIKYATEKNIRNAALRQYNID